MLSTNTLVIVVLKKTLETLFQQYGKVLDVTAYSNIRARGQAFVAFEEEDSATKAIKELQHFVLYDKPLVLQYARQKSDVHAKLDGNFDEHHAARLEEKCGCWAYSCFRNPKQNY